MHCADVVLKLVSVSVPLIGCSVVFLLHCDERSMEAHFCQKKKTRKERNPIHGNILNHMQL